MRKLHLVVHRDLKRLPAVRAVIDALVEIFKRETPRLLGQDTAARRATVAQGPADSSQVA